MNEDRKKYIGKEFLRQMKLLSSAPDEFEEALKSFSASEAQNRFCIASGLLAVGADPTESAFQRSFALAMLATIINVCGLRSQDGFEQELDQIVGDPAQEYDRLHQKDRVYANELYEANLWRIKVSALIALTAVNRGLGMKRIEDFIGFYGDSQYGLELREIRAHISK
jgi:hypothetical protein